MRLVPWPHFLAKLDTPTPAYLRLLARSTYAKRRKQKVEKEKG